MNPYRTHYCGQINENLLGQTVWLSAWVHRTRDHGGVNFVDLRDYTGFVQLVFHPEDTVSFELSKELRSEYVIQIEGTVQRRPEGTANAELASGQVEVAIKRLTIVNRAKVLPFRLDEYQPEVSEELRLKYRYLDMRTPELNNRLRFRAKAVQFLRRYLEKLNFIEVETPILTRSTPEGARDYLVPSRTHLGSFFALPQSPQVFKQLMMVGGIDRYYQVARCFRDEDLRADRQPEFTQLDIEASFVREEDIRGWVEGMIRALFSELLGVSLPDPFLVMSYSDAMRRYGIDRPDLRIPLELVDVEDLVASTEFQVFSRPAQDPKGRVVALRVPQGAERLSRKAMDDYEAFVAQHGAKGLAYIKCTAEGPQSPIIKFLGETIVEAILKRADAQVGDMIFFGAGSAKIVNGSMAALRVKLGYDLGLLEGEWKPLWVVGFPMLEQDDEGKWQFVHNPFSSPHAKDPEAFRKNPEVTTRGYDFVLNGIEVGGGSIRTHDYAMQMAVFQLLGLTETQAKEQFGHLLDGLQSGCPPHGGIALGIDRLIMMMTGGTSIRQVIAFPKTQTAACPLTQAPSSVSEAQLKELAIVVKNQIK